MRPLSVSRNIHRASGEQLLLMAVFGNARVKQAVDRELDRRARLGHRPQAGQRATAKCAA